MFLLVDCNNFFVSCERVFNPALLYQPVVVLSNNDGCVIARSNEAKALGIKMGEPYFKCKHIIKQNKIQIFSSNYNLYADMSKRVMRSLEYFANEVAIYSVDEAFIKVEITDRQQLTDLANRISTKILQWTGIPVSIGVAPTKTLSKAANLLAKKYYNSNLCFLLNHTEQKIALSKLHIEDIWGISNKLTVRLNQLSIYSALDLCDADTKMMRKHSSVIMEKIIYELRGQQCFPLHCRINSKKSITASRSFGNVITSITQLEEAIANYAAKACFKLRQQNSTTQTIAIMLKSKQYANNYKTCILSQNVSFEVPTSDSRIIIKAAKNLIHSLYRPGYCYKKCGIILYDLLDAEYQQHNLFAKHDTPKSAKLMKVMDQVNSYIGSNSLFYLSQGIKRDWSMRSNYCSPQYTTNWNELPAAR